MDEETSLLLSTTLSMPQSVKDYERILTDLKRDNFNLKVRIYYLEEKFGHVSPSCDGDQSRDDSIRESNISLRIENENLKEELSKKQSLLQKAADALDCIVKRREEDKIDVKQQCEDEFNIIKSNLHNKLAVAEQEVTKLHSELAGLRTKSVSFSLDEKSLNNRAAGVSNLPRPISQSSNLAPDKIRDKLSKFEEKVRSLAIEKAALGRDVDRLQEQCDVRSSENTKLTESVDTSDAKYKTVLKMNENLEGEVARLKAELGDVELKLDESAKKHDELAAKITSGADTEESLKRTKEKLTQMSAENLKLAENCRVYEEKCIGYMKNNAKLKQERNFDRDELTKVNVKISSSQESLKTLESKLKELDCNNEILVTEMSNKDHTIDTLDKQIGRFKQENEKLGEDYRGINTKLSGLEREKSKVEARNRDLENEISKLGSKMKETGDVNEILVSELRDKDSVLEKLSGELSGYKEVSSRVNEENNRLMSEMERIEKEAGGLKDELEKLRENDSERSREKDLAQDELRRRLTAARDRSKLLAGENEKLRSDNSSLGEQVRNFKIEIENLNSAGPLQEQVERRNAEMGGLYQKLTLMEDSVGGLNKILSEKELLLAHHKVNALKRDKTIQGLTDLVHRLQASNRRLKSEVKIRRTAAVSKEVRDSVESWSSVEEKSEDLSEASSLDHSEKITNVETLRAKIQQLEKQLRSREEESQSEDLERKELIEHIKNLQAGVEERNVTIAELRATLVPDDSDHSELEQSVARRDEQITELKTALRTLKNTLAESSESHNKTVNEKQVLIDQLRKQTGDNEKLIKLMRAEREELGKTNETAMARLMSCLDEKDTRYRLCVSQHRESVARKNGEIQGLHQQLAAQLSSEGKDSGCVDVTPSMSSIGSCSESQNSVGKTIVDGTIGGRTIGVDVEIQTDSDCNPTVTELQQQLCERSQELKEALQAEAALCDTVDRMQQKYQHLESVVKFIPPIGGDRSEFRVLTSSPAGQSQAGTPTSHAYITKLSSFTPTTNNDLSQYTISTMRDSRGHVTSDTIADATLTNASPRSCDVGSGNDWLPGIASDMRKEFDFGGNVNAFDVDHVIRELKTENETLKVKLKATEEKVIELNRRWDDVIRERDEVMRERSDVVDEKTEEISTLRTRVGDLEQQCEVLHSKLLSTEQTVHVQSHRIREQWKVIEHTGLSQPLSPKRSSSDSNLNTSTHSTRTTVENELYTQTQVLHSTTTPVHNPDLLTPQTLRRSDDPDQLRAEIVTLKRALADERAGSRPKPDVVDESPWQQPCGDELSTPDQAVFDQLRDQVFSLRQDLELNSYVQASMVDVSQNCTLATTKQSNNSMLATPKHSNNSTLATPKHSNNSTLATPKASNNSMRGNVSELNQTGVFYHRLTDALGNIDKLMQAFSSDAVKSLQDDEKRRLKAELAKRTELNNRLKKLLESNHTIASVSNTELESIRAEVQEKNSLISKQQQQIRRLNNVLSNSQSTDMCTASAALNKRPAVLSEMKNLQDENSLLKLEVSGLKRKNVNKGQVINFTLKRLETMYDDKKGMEDTLVKHLTKTYRVLSEAKENLQQQVTDNVVKSQQSL